MCVILLSPQGNTAPTEEQIKQAFRRNPDGAGFAYCDKQGKVKFEKGFMKVDDLIKRLSPLDQWTNTTLAIHFRIGTAGKNDQYTCHPFMISNKYADLRKLEGDGPVLFHNGVLDTGGLADPLSSDTQDFTIAYAPMLAKYNKSKTRDRFIESAVSGSRLLCMYDGNRVKLFGKWEKSDDGNLLVSNKLWEGGYYTYGYGYGYDYDKWDKWYGYDKTPSNNLSLTEDEVDKAFNITTSTSSTDRVTAESLHKSYVEELAKEAWEKLKKKRYVMVDNLEVLDEMVNTADTIESYALVKDGVYYLYDEDSMCVWDASIDDFE